MSAELITQDLRVFLKLVIGYQMSPEVHFLPPTPERK